MGQNELLKEVKDTLRSIDGTLKRIERTLLSLEQDSKTESAEEFYKKHGITQTFA